MRIFKKQQQDNNPAIKEGIASIQIISAESENHANKFVKLIYLDEWKSSHYDIEAQSFVFPGSIRNFENSNQSECKKIKACFYGFPEKKHNLPSDSGFIWQHQFYRYPTAQIFILDINNNTLDNKKLNTLITQSKEKTSPSCKNCSRYLIIMNEGKTNVTQNKITEFVNKHNLTGYFCLDMKNNRENYKEIIKKIVLESTPCNELKISANDNKCIIF